MHTTHINSFRKQQLLGFTSYFYVSFFVSIIYNSNNGGGVYFFHNGYI